MPGEVFISYARKDTAFVRRLHQALAALNRDAWIDWEDIPLTADWWREIQTGIEAADTFVFVISPDSAQSQICYREIDYAAQHNKRLMPIMHREIADPVVEQKLHPAINAHNWAFFRDTDNFDTSFQALIDAMDTDLAYVREHTRLLVRARNWEAHHHDPSQLLRDNDLRVAEDWLAKGLQKQRNRPADLHVTYIHRSRRAQNRRMQRTVVLAILIALIIGLMIASLLLREDARMAQEKAVKERQISEAIGLAAQAQLELFGSVPERGVLLALEALDADRPYVWEADRALGAAVQISHARSIFAGHEGQINDVAWSPDGTRVATASQTASDPPSGSVIIWDAASGQPIVFTDPANNEPRFVLSGHTSVVTSVAWSPDSRYIITGSRDATAKIWDTSTGTEIDTIYGHGAEWINDVAWSPDGAYVATASNDETSKIWRVADRLTPAADTPNQAYMVQTYNPEEERGLIAVLAGHTGSVKGVAWSPDNAALVTISEDETIRIWYIDGSLWTIIGDENTQHTDGINAVDWSAKGNLILTGSRDDTAKVWDVASGALLFTLNQHVGDVTSVQFAPDSVTFATTSQDRTIRVYDTATGAAVFTASGHNNRITGLDWSPDGRRLVTSSKDQTARAWDSLAGNAPVPLIGHTGRVTSAAWSPDGARVITTSTDNTARLWDTATGATLVVFENVQSGANNVAWSPDGTQIAFITRDRSIELRDPVSGYILRTIAIGGAPTSIAWSADSTQLVIPVGVSVGLWDVATGTETARLETTGPILLAKLAPAGTQLLTLGSRDNAITVWDLTTGQPIFTVTQKSITQEVISINDVAWSPDGTRLAYGDEDGTGHILDARTGAERQLLTGHTDGILGVSWSPDSQRVITASRDRSARVWAAADGSELLTLTGHSDELANVVWSPTGDQAITTSGDQTAQVWPVWLTAGDLVAFAQECCVFRNLTPEERAQFNLPTAE